MTATSGQECYIDGSQISDMPQDDSYFHNEPEIYQLPTGDLVLQIRCSRPALALVADPTGQCTHFLREFRNVRYIIVDPVKNH